MFFNTSPNLIKKGSTHFTQGVLLGGKLFTEGNNNCVSGEVMTTNLASNRPIKLIGLGLRQGLSGDAGAQTPM